METGNNKLEVSRLFFEINKTLKRSMRNIFEDAGITMPQGLVISILTQAGEMKLTELGRKTNLSNSTISGIIDRLEKQQLVVRTRSESDRRIVYVKATPRFEKIHKEIYKKAEENFENILSAGSSEEIEKIIEGLNILKKILTLKKDK